MLMLTQQHKDVIGTIARTMGDEQSVCCVVGPSRQEVTDIESSRDDREEMEQVDEDECGS